MFKPSTLSGTISDLAFGGKGILRSEEGKVFFVPFTIPGEEIICEIIKEKKDYGEATCKKILKPSKDRIPPLCPYFGTCGGCQLQHIRYEAQADLKKRMVEEALGRLFPNTEVTFNPSPTPWAYRRKIHLTLKPGSNGFKTGFITFDNRSLVEVKECPIFVAQDNSIIKLCAEIAAKLEAAPDNSGKALLLKTDNGDFILHFHFKKMPQNAEEILKNAFKKPFHALFCSTPRKKLTFGEKDLSLTQGSLTLRYNSEAFLQNHPEMSSALYSFIEKTISKAKPSLLIDLYAGIGITSLLAAPHCKSLESIEFNAEAVRLSRLNSKENQIRYTAHQGMVEELLPKLLQKKPQAALCNPPREGMNQDACMLLAQSSIHTLLYTSCHPATLARDLRHFKAKGFNLIEAIAFDMFPQTGHVETVVHLERS